MNFKLKQNVFDENGGVLEARIYSETEALRIPKLAYDLGLVEKIEEPKTEVKTRIKVEQQPKKEIEKEKE